MNAHHARRALRRAATAVALSAAVGGCVLSRHILSRHVLSVRLYEGFDDSDSSRSSLSGFARSGAGLISRLTPETDRLAMYSVDFQTTELSDGDAPDSSETALAVLNSDLMKPPARKDTFPDRFWTEMAARASKDREPVAIVLYSDGDNDDQRAASFERIRAAARRLASNPRVACIAVCGVSPRNRRYLRDCFGPMGDRFLMFGQEETDVARIAERLDAARAGKELK